MAITQVSIANSALIKVGADTISSITEDVKRAKIIKALWDQVRDEVMAAHPWNFAIKRSKLSPVSDSPEFEYAYAFDKPLDCLRILDEEGPSTDYVIEDGKILSNEPSLNLRYIYRNTDESSWSPGFAESFAWRMAREIAYALAQSTQLLDLCDKQYRASLAEARFMDGSEGITKNLVIDDWTLSRR